MALPAYAGHALARLPVPDLIGILQRDKDRVPRNVVDECARRGEEMAAALESLIGSERFWREGAPLGEWWSRLHAAMVLGLIESERAGLALAAFLRRMDDAEDENLADWLAGYWPALFRNKPPGVLPALREVALDRGLGWYTRIQAIDAVIGHAGGDGGEALDAALDWAAAIAADASDDSMLRHAAGSQLLDFPRERHRLLLERLAAEQERGFCQFDAADVTRAYTGGLDEPEWRRFKEPWHFYSPRSIAARQERWAKEAAEAREEDAAGEQWLAERNAGTYVRDVPKIGRNDPCPCGSGKKHKRCCLGRTAGLNA